MRSQMTGSPAFTRTSIVAVTTVLAAGAIAGCGGGGTSKATVIRRADAICSQYNKSRSTIPQPSVSPDQLSKSNIKQFTTFLDKSVPSLKAELAKLEALPNPKQDAALWKRTLAGASSQVSAFDNARKLADSGNVAALKTALKTALSDVGNSSQLAKQFGLRVCGQPQGGASR